MATAIDVLPPESPSYVFRNTDPVQEATQPVLPSISSPQQRPIAPIPSPSVRRTTSGTSQSGSPVTPRVSSRARKPSAKVAEMAEAGPSGTSGLGAGVREEVNPEPGYLQPDHFCELNNGAKPATSSKSRWEPLYPAQSQFLSPEDDPLALRGIPIFRPTMEEFQDFEAYVTRTVPWGMRSGIVKVVPPTEWTESLPPMSAQTLSQVQIKSPIQQNMMGTAGIFRAQNIEKNKTRPLSVKEWFDKCQNEKFAGPSPKSFDRDSCEARLAREEVMKEKKEKVAKKREDKRRRREERTMRVEVPSSQEEKEEDEIMNEEQTGEGETEEVPALDAPSSGSSHSSPVPKTPELDQFDDWYQTTDFRTAWLPRNTQPEDYTTEACARLQEKYWKTMGLGEPSWYGADLMQGSLFADVKTPWNVAHLPNLLDRVDCVVPGVNEPYLYFGMWRATFAWHVEDMDLFSINYIHFGAPKFWYAIPQGQADHFERFLANEFPLDARECNQFIRHKSMAISPTKLKDAQTRVNMLVHNQGEFVITYPRGYHAGFNMGFNCAESVNFALDSWIEHGRKAKHCKCVSYSVRIDVDKMLTEAADAVYQAAGAVVAKRQRQVEEDQAVEQDTNVPKPKKRPRKSKAPLEIPIEECPAYRGTDAEQVIHLTTPSQIPPQIPPRQSNQTKTKRPPKAAKTQIVQDRPVCPCLFCPSLSMEELCPVYEPNDFVKGQWKGQPRAQLMVHLSCAQSTPECYFAEEVVDGKEVIWVMGVNDVVKDRWSKLKCKVCIDKITAATGVKVQCTKGKCPVAFHYSCARADEHVKAEIWQVEELRPAAVPADAPEGTQPEMEKVPTLRLELLCQAHNPAQKEVRERQKAEELKQRILRIIPGEMVKIKSGSGSIEYKLLSIRETERMIEVQIVPGHSMMAAWTRVDFRGSAPKLAENDYARQHLHSRKSSAQTTSTHPNTLVPDPQPTIQSAPPKKVHPPSSAAYASRTITAPAHAPAPISSTTTTLYPYMSAPTPYQPIPTQLCPPHYSQAQYWNQYPRQVLHPEPLPPIPNRVYCVSSNDPSYATSYATYPYSASYMPQYYGVTQPVYGSYPGNKAYYPPPPPGQYSSSYPAPTYVNTVQHGPPQHSMSQVDHRLRMQASESPDPLLLAPAQRTQPPMIRSHNPAPAPSRGQPGPAGMRHLMNPAPSAALAPSIPQPGPSVAPAHGAGKIDLGLNRMRELVGALPPITTPAIHIAGTNGKGSVSAMLESVLRMAGLRTARYNSPHLLEPRDAIRLDGIPVSANDYRQAMYHVDRMAKKLVIKATSFEIATAAAYTLITGFKPDIMIIECGMGGARDATNVIPPEYVLATALTSVGLDHTAFLGDTIEAITEEKSNIAVKGGLFFVSKQTDPNVSLLARRVANARGARYITATGSFALPETQGVEVIPGQAGFFKPKLPKYKFLLDSIQGHTQSVMFDIRVPLPGAHQADNAGLAITILHHLRRDHERARNILPKLAQITQEHIQQGIESATWAGRCSWLPYKGSEGQASQILVDGAHNADSAKTLREYIDSCRPEARKVTFVLGLSESKGKTPESVLQPLLRPGDNVAIVEFAHPVEGMPWIKPVPIEVLTPIVKGLMGNGKVWQATETDAEKGLGAALQWAEGWKGLTVVCGSLYLVADVYRLLGLQGEV